MPQVFFTSEISGQTFAFGAGTRRVIFSIRYASGVPYTIFSQEYATRDGSVHVTGIGRILESHMRSQGIIAGTYTIAAADPDTATEKTTALAAIMCPGRYPAPAEQWTQAHFLTDHTHTWLPQSFALTVTLHWYSDIAGLCSRQVTHSGPGLVTISGDSRKQHYIFLPDTALPTVVFRYINTFGAIEYTSFQGITSLSPSQTATQVTVQGITRKVDCTREDTYTLTAAEIPQSRALAAAALLHARQAWIVDNPSDPGSSLTEITVTSVDGEISDSLSQLCSVTIKYSHARK